MTYLEEGESFRAKHPALFISQEEATARFLDSMGYDGYKVMSLTRPAPEEEVEARPTLTVVTKENSDD